MFRVIKVYGKLAKHVGQRSFKAAVKSPAEAVRFLLANFPSLRGVLSEGDYKVSVGRSELEIGDHPEYIHFPAAPFEPIRIIPVIAGAGGGTGKILAGVGLIALAVLAAPVGGGFLGLGQGAFGAIGPFATGLHTGFTLGAAASSAIGAIGAAMVIGGVAQLISPTPKLGGANIRGVDDETDPRRSFSFSGVQNVTRQGVPVPIIYGEVFTGSVVITASLNVEEVTG